MLISTYRPEQPRDPLGAYGRTKAAGKEPTHHAGVPAARPAAQHVDHHRREQAGLFGLGTPGEAASPAVAGGEAAAEGAFPSRLPPAPTCPVGQRQALLFPVPEQPGPDPALASGSAG